MPVFEPSTWAEVEEAVVSKKPSAQTGDEFVAQVRAFTNAPERYMTSIPTSSTNTSSGRDRGIRALDAPTFSEANQPEGPGSFESLSRERNPRRPIAPAKRSDAQFDDLLGQGRVDLDTQSFVRRYASPGEISHDSMFPAATATARPNAACINPSSDKFDPVQYLGKVHQESTVEQLLSGKTVLQQVKAQLDQRAENFGREKFVNAVLVEAAFEGTKTSLMPISPYADKGSAPEDAFNRAETMLKSRYEGVMQREGMLTRLQRSLSVFKQNRWIFTLGARLKDAARDDITKMEGLVREYQSASQWLDVQDSADLKIIKNSIESGFTVLMNSVRSRLSSEQLSRQDSSVIVSLLISVKREQLITDVLTKRTAQGLDGLQKALRSVDVGITLSGRGGVKTGSEVVDLINRVSTAFIDGLTHIWELGCILIVHEQWTGIVETNVTQLCASFAQVVSEHLLTDLCLLSIEPVKRIGQIREKASFKLQVTSSCLGPLEDVHGEVIDLFLKSVAGSVRGEAEQAAIRAVKSDTVGATCVHVLLTIATEALTQLEATMKPILEGILLDEQSNSTRSLVEREDEGFEEEVFDIGEDFSKSTAELPKMRGALGSQKSLSSAELVTVACAEMGAIFAEKVYSRMKASESDQEVAALKVAVCCTELNRSVLDEIMQKVTRCKLPSLRLARRQSRVTQQLVRDILDQSLSQYVTMVSQPLQDLARGLVLFPEEDIGECVRRTIPIKIEGVSKHVSEATLQMALITITTRRKSANKGLILQILLELIRIVGETLVEALSTDKMAYHRGAQLWVDVTFLHDVVTNGADAESDQVQEAVSAFGRVRERAVQAVLADGLSFSVADMQTLRENVVAAAIDESCMVSECFRETWAFIRARDD